MAWLVPHQLPPDQIAFCPWCLLVVETERARELGAHSTVHQLLDGTTVTRIHHFHHLSLGTSPSFKSTKALKTLSTGGLLVQRESVFWKRHLLQAFFQVLNILGKNPSEVWFEVRSFKLRSNFVSLGERKNLVTFFKQMIVHVVEVEQVIPLTFFIQSES
jgi:hypothetical protein